MEVLVQFLGWNLSTLQGLQLVLKDLLHLSASKDETLLQDNAHPQFGEVCWRSFANGWDHDLIHLLLLWLLFVLLTYSHVKTYGPCDGVRRWDLGTNISPGVELF